MAHQYYNRHASFIYLWYGCNNVTYFSYHTYNTCVPYNTYGPYNQIGVNCTYGACGTYGAYGTCGSFGAYGACGTCVMYADEKCGTFVVDVECGTYVTHAPYSEMVHTSMDLPNQYKRVFTNGSKNKIKSTPNVQNFVRSHAYE
jgi:hypothetical protein